MIYKGETLNSKWVPPTAPLEWLYTNSSSGWTSDTLGLEWLTNVFEPKKKPKNPDLRRLLVIDGHGSHVTGDFIAKAIEYKIDLCVFPPHSSHILQPLDVGVFRSLKGALSFEIDRLSCLDPGRVSKAEWTELFIRAREKAITRSNITASFRSTGIYPLSPITVLTKLENPPLSYGPLPRTRPDKTPFDISLSTSSPPEGTELHAAIELLSSTISRAIDVVTPAKRFTEKATRLLEEQNTELTLLRKQFKEVSELLQTRAKRKKGKRITLDGKHIVSTEEVLEDVRKAEAEVTKRKPRKKRKIEVTTAKLPEIADQYIENQSESDDDCIIVGRATIK